MLMISGFCLTGSIVYRRGYRLNFTRSLPVGLWKREGNIVDYDTTEKITTVNGRKTSGAVIRAISVRCPRTCLSLRNYS